MGSQFCFIGLCVYFWLVSYFDYYSFVVQVEIRKYGASNFVLLSQDYLGYLGSYNAYLALTNLGILFFSVSVKNAFWIYIGIPLTLQMTLGSEGF